MSKCFSQESADDCRWESVGGLAGNNNGEISNSYVSGAVSNRSHAVGGLVGKNFGTIRGSYATASVTGSGSGGSDQEHLGGLAGTNEGVIKASYATGVLTGKGRNFGGLAGWNANGASIAASYATGAVSGSGRYTGGLAGSNSGEITASYAAGKVSGGSEMGGLMGYDNSGGKVTASYWDTQTTGQASSPAGIGKTTEELQGPVGYTGIYANWNLDLNDDDSADDPWDFGNSCQFPVLKAGNLNPDDQRARCAQSPTDAGSNVILIEATADVKVETTDDMKIQRLTLPQGFSIEPAFRPDHYDYRVIVPTDLETLELDGQFTTPFVHWNPGGGYLYGGAYTAYIVVSENLSVTEADWDDRSLWREGRGPYRDIKSFSDLLATLHKGSLKETHREYYPSFRAGKFDLAQGEATTAQIGLYKWRHGRIFEEPFAENIIRQVYTLTVNRGLPGADDAALHDLTISAGALDFDRDAAAIMRASNTTRRASS